MKLLIFFFTSCLFLACSSQPKGSQSVDDMAFPASETPQATTWKLVQYGPIGALSEVPARVEVTLLFDEAAQRLSGLAGCNQYFAGYTLQEDALTVSPPGATKKFCHSPENIMALESTFLQYLSEAEHLTDEGTELVLTCKGGNLLVFVKI